MSAQECPREKLGSRGTLSPGSTEKEHTAQGEEVNHRMPRVSGNGVSQG